jgi:hypothetical protein
LTILSGVGLSVEDELFWIASGEVMTMRDCRLVGRGQKRLSF